MRPLTATALLDAWERGLAATPVERALVLLAAACPELAPEELAAESIGRRDARLLDLRELTFGPELACVAACPACAERLEMAFQVSDVRTSPMPLISVVPPQEPVEVAVAGWELCLRLPDSSDLAAVTGAGHDPGRARDELLARCLVAATRGGEPGSVVELPAAVAAEAVARLGEADPQADVRLALACPACGHGWECLFDIASFLWSEVHAWASRLLIEVHTLATAYGWSEPEILALTPRRRSHYLRMVAP